jgi:5'-nucleotidase
MATIRTVPGGHLFDLLHPETSRIEIEDIAHALSNQCRFTGHVREFYSVAQHSVIASLLVPQEDALHALLHYAAEAYLGDVSRPLKSLLPDYRAIERTVEAAVLAAFGLDPAMPASVKAADNVMLATEKRDLRPQHDDRGSDDAKAIPCPWRIWPWPPKRAYAEFMRRYHDLRPLPDMRNVQFIGIDLAAGADDYAVWLNCTGVKQ